MISLSNRNSYKYVDEAKVIKLKPISIKQVLKPIEDVPPEEKLKTINDEIQEAEEQLSQLRQQYETERDLLMKEIEQQKLNWEEERNQLIEQAQQIGYQKGFERGQNEGLQALQEQIDEINRLEDLAKKNYQAKVDSSSDMIIQLSIEVAEKIIGQKIAEDPNLFESIVSTALKTVKTEDRISLYVHPSMYELLLQQKEELQKHIDGKGEIQIYIDNQLSETGCIVEHAFGRIDVGVDTQLEEIHKVLQNISNGE